ncbi:MAG TPA: DUF1223 domain-containing protein [Stellaceae bacterium]|jgi:hypothetical protein|nr:DUF1223 domain-containing protein [Stellaceae bacterium]
MIKALALFVTLGLTQAATPVTAAERPTVVVELFTSEGCSSCPPADALLAQLATRPDMLALSFHVDYWDRLGWKDPFSSAAATARQQHYAELLGIGTVYTPQIVVAGHWQAVGSDRGEVEQALAAAATGTPPTVPVTLAVERGHALVTLASDGASAKGSILLVAFDRRRVDAVERGENEGRTLTHADVVRGFTVIGRSDGATHTIEAAVPWPADRLAAILQADDGRILGAAVADLTPH